MSGQSLDSDPRLDSPPRVVRVTKRKGVPIKVSEKSLANLRPFQPGHKFGQLGAGAPLRKVRDACKHRSPEAVDELYKILLKDPDGRNRIVAAQQILTWAFGRPENLKPDDGEAKPALDVSKLSTNELRVLLKALQSGRVADQVAPAGADDGGEPGEPTVIEGTAEAT